MPIITRDSDNSRIQPLIDRQLSSCCEKPDSALLDENSCAARLIKYAPAAAISPSITHSTTSVISLFAENVSAIPVAKIGIKATAGAKNRLSESFLISFSTQRIAPMDTTTAMYRKDDTGDANK